MKDMDLYFNILEPQQLVQGAPYGYSSIHVEHSVRVNVFVSWSFVNSKDAYLKTHMCKHKGHRW